ncbi:MAG: hypothetical protein AAEJ52_22880 [Myxococcota bacterium]|jgi:hypothetical protein
MAQRQGKQRTIAKSPKAAHSHAPEADESAGPVPEMMRRALTLGLTGFFTTEGALRKALEDTVPKDWTDFLAETSDRTRSEFLERLSGEIGRVLDGVDIAAVIQELLLGRTLEVKAEIRLSDEPSDGVTGSPTIRFSAPDPTAKRSGAAAHEAEAQGDD